MVLYKRWLSGIPNFVEILFFNKVEYRKFLPVHDTKVFLVKGKIDIVWKLTFCSSEDKYFISNEVDKPNLDRKEKFYPHFYILLQHEFV